MDASAGRQRSRIYANLASAFSEAMPGLESEFTRLFLGPGRPVAHPSESVYREGRTMGDTTLDVRNRLISEGLTPVDRALPDHVSVELAFMSHLAAREALAWDAGDDELARDYLERQKSFLYDHLIVWLPQFCHRVLVSRPHAYFADLARRAETFVTSDAERVRTWIESGTGAITDGLRARAWWAVTVDQGCTLCDICVQVCRPGALQRNRQQGAIILRFDATVCDGCAACQRWCPEDVISLSPMDERLHDTELARSAMLACPGCGQLHAPAAMVDKVQDQLGADGEALTSQLTLCSNCKLTGMPLRRRNSTRHVAPS